VFTTPGLSDGTTFAPVFGLATVSLVFGVSACFVVSEVFG